jgi:hypothetical protein
LKERRNDFLLFSSSAGGFFALLQFLLQTGHTGIDARSLSIARLASLANWTGATGTDGRMQEAWSPGFSRQRVQRCKEIATIMNAESS